MRAQETAGLVAAAAGGDAGAWRALVAEFGGVVWAVARGMGLAAADAEDVSQVTWFRLAEHIGRLKEPERVGAWLVTTARNEALKVARARHRVVPAGEELVAGVDARSPEQAVLEAEAEKAQAERLRRLWAAFQELPDRCALLLRLLMATPAPSYADVAAATGMPVGSIGPTRARCLAKLRGLIGGR